jgi:hypothetical protein
MPPIQQSLEGPDSNDSDIQNHVVVVPINEGVESRIEQLVDINRIMIQEVEDESSESEEELVTAIPNDEKLEIELKTLSTLEDLKRSVREGLEWEELQSDALPEEGIFDEVWFEPVSDDT